MTRVISVRGKKREDLEKDHQFVYVGRAVRYTTWNRRSIYANPFSKPWDDMSPVELFEEHLARRIAVEPDVLRRLIADLRGMTLGCWCGTWEPGRPEIGCHAVILAILAEGGVI